MVYPFLRNNSLYTDGIVLVHVQIVDMYPSQNYAMNCDVFKRYTEQSCFIKIVL